MRVNSNSRNVSETRDYLNVLSLGAVNRTQTKIDRDFDASISAKEASFEQNPALDPKSNLKQGDEWSALALGGRDGGVSKGLVSIAANNAFDSYHKAALAFLTNDEIFSESITDAREIERVAFSESMAGARKMGRVAERFGIENVSEQVSAIMIAIKLVHKENEAKSTPIGSKQTTPVPQHLETDPSTPMKARVPSRLVYQTENISGGVPELLLDGSTAEFGRKAEIWFAESLPAYVQVLRKLKEDGTFMHADNQELLVQSNEKLALNVMNFARRTNARKTSYSRMELASSFKSFVRSEISLLDESGHAEGEDRRYSLIERDARVLWRGALGFMVGKVAEDVDLFGLSERQKASEECFAAVMLPALYDMVVRNKMEELAVLRAES